MTKEAAPMALPKDQDCSTIVIDALNGTTSSQGSRPSSDGGPGWTPTGPTDSNTAAAAAGVLTTTAAAPTAVAKSPPARIYYIDWLRVFLTLIVVMHHCVTCYLSSWAPWVTQQKKSDNALWLLVQLFVNGNQAYFMTLFFFISGLYVPGSLRRKGAWHFLVDRTLRLVVPCVVYSLVAAPFIIWLTLGADQKKAGPSLGQAFADWLKPGWPMQYNLATGPLWFNWMLWWFNVAYVILQKISQLFAHSRSKSKAAQQLPQSTPTKTKAATTEFTTRQWVIGAAAVITVLTVLCFAARVLDYMVWDLQPAEFYKIGPVVAFMPDFFVVYIVAFGLGTFSGPAGWNVLARLPSGYATWWLALGGVWWLQAGWLINIALFSYMAGQKGIVAFCFSNLLKTFVEQSFCVVWSAGLLVLFRSAYNIKPNWLGLQIIGAAYGAYIVHQIFITIYARAFMHVAAAFTSHVLTAAAISGPVLISAWLFAMALRALPGAKRVL